MPVTPKRPTIGALALFWTSLAMAGSFASACGSRTSLTISPPAPECRNDADCPGFDDKCHPVACALHKNDADAGADERKLPGGVCVFLAPLDCDDRDPCSDDSCEPSDGTCHYAAATRDLDGDGHKAPLPGKAPGAPDACGDDCDDSHANALPGGTEVCDGVDNDCNGIVDDNATYEPAALDAVRISGDLAPASPGGIAFSGGSYLAVYGGTSGGFDLYEHRLNPDGTTVAPGEQRLTEINADSSGGPLVWIGDRYGLAWQDRRVGDYETYFSLLKEDGSKVIADTRLADAPGFSVNVVLVWNGKEFLAVWQDDRNGEFDLFGQRVSVDGALIGGNVALTKPTGIDDEAPSIASGTQGLGAAWSYGDSTGSFIVFQLFDPKLSPSAATPAPIELTDGSTQAVYPNIVFNPGPAGKPGSYVVAWFDRSADPRAIYACVLSESGELLVPPKPITSPGTFRSRYPFLLPLGDRVQLIYSDDRDHNQGYEIYTRRVGAMLDTFGPEMRLTNAARDSVYPIAAFGPAGEIGVLFRDDRENGEHNVYFTHLGCVTSPH